MHALHTFKSTVFGTTCTYLHSHVCAFMRIYTHVHAHVRIWTFVCESVLICACACTHIACDAYCNALLNACRDAHETPIEPLCKQTDNRWPAYGSGMAGW